MGKKKPILLSLLVLTASLLTIFLYSSSKKTYAGFLTQMSNTLSRIQASAAANHTIEFITPSGVNTSSATIVFTFGTAGDFTLTSVTHASIDLLVDSGGTCSGTWTGKTLGATAGVDVWGAVANNGAGTITLTSPTNAGSGEIAAGSCVQVLIGTNATGGTNQITNPSTADSYTIGITGTFGDEGYLAVAIVTDDQIDISAAVDPTLDVIISTNVCPLGTLSSNLIETCSYDVTVSTNALSGYFSTILVDGQLRNAVNQIANVAGGTVVVGTEEYGAGTSKTGQDLVQNTACTDADTGPSQPASALTTSAQQFANSTGPVSSDATTVCHLATVAAITPAGLYSQVATIVVTGNF